MAVIGVCIQDTPENDRHPVTIASVNSLLATVDLSRHHVMLIDNGSTDQRTVDFLRRKWQVERVRFRENYFNHAAFNYTFQRAGEDEVAIIVENDVVFGERGWADFLEGAVGQTPFSVVALAAPELHHLFDPRKIQTETHTVNGRPYEIDLVRGVWNGCTAFSSATRRRVGYFKPPREGYGYNDPLMSLRLERSGIRMGLAWDFKLQYIGRSRTEAYHQWKKREVEKGSDGFRELEQAYRSARRDTYEPMNPPIQIERNFYT